MAAALAAVDDEPDYHNLLLVMKTVYVMLSLVFPHVSEDEEGETVAQVEPDFHTQLIVLKTIFVMLSLVFPHTSQEQDEPPAS